MEDHKVNVPFVQLENFATAYIAKPVTFPSKYGILLCNDNWKGSDSMTDEEYMREALI